MSDWTAGYVADIGYTYGYYNELNPQRVKLAFLTQGLVCPEFGAACELGFGQGLSVNLHAAASVIQWHGTDFNPSQASFAQELAAASDAAPQLYDEAFIDFKNRTDLPEFDYIGLHGIWSWISDENRQVIVEFVRKKLKVGGVLYISYNSLPGWGTFAPMRHLLTQHAEVLGSQGKGIVSRIDGALDFADKLLATNPTFLRANPLVADRLKHMTSLNRQYLAHEYFNRDWQPMHFATMADWLSDAKVQYACSAHYPDLMDVINLTNEQQSFLNGIPDPTFRETARDFMVNQQFRRDYWVKGARKLSPLERAEQLSEIRVILTSSVADIELKITGALGEATLTESVYQPILDLLGDHKARTLGQLQRGIEGKGISFSQITQAILVLVGAGHVEFAQEDAVTAKAKKQTDKLNIALIRRSRGGSDISNLASPVTGGGVTVSRFHQLFLLARQRGHKTPRDWAQFTWALLTEQGQQLRKDGKTLETAEENVAELTDQAQIFAGKQLPILTALQIA